MHSIRNVVVGQGYVGLPPTVETAGARDNTIGSDLVPRVQDYAGDRAFKEADWRGVLVRIDTDRQGLR